MNMPIEIRGAGTIQSPEKVVDSHNNVFGRSAIEVMDQDGKTHMYKLDAEQTELILKIIGAVNV